MVWTIATHLFAASIGATLGLVVAGLCRAAKEEA